MSLWNSWISQDWQALLARKHLPVPAGLPHPARAGFSPVALSTPAGQYRDWSLPLTDHSRIHVHEFPDGRLVAHRDRFDPERGPLYAAAHLIAETEFGLAAAIVLGVVLLSRAKAHPA